MYAIERFLHRLGRSPFRDHLILKGALLLRQWLGAETRPTRDIDLLGSVELREDGLRGILSDLLCAQVEEDGIEFDPDTIAVRPIRGDSNVLGLRAKFDAHLGRAKLRYQVDVGLGDDVFPPTVEIIPGGLLGLPMAGVPGEEPAPGSRNRSSRRGRERPQLCTAGAGRGPGGSLVPAALAQWRTLAAWKRER